MASIQPVISPSIPLRALYPIKEARQLLGGMSHTAFYDWVKRGDIQVTKLGRRTYVHADEINRIARREAGR